MARWHRLAVEPDLLSESPRHPCHGIGERYLLRAYPAPAAPHPTQGVDQRHRVLRPRQVVPGAVLGIAHARAPSTAATARVPPGCTSFDADPDTCPQPFVLEFQGLHAETIQAQQLGKLLLRSHLVLPCAGKPREDTTGMVRWRVGSPVLTCSYAHRYRESAAFETTKSLLFALVVVGWVALQTWSLPRKGLPRCVSLRLPETSFRPVGTTSVAAHLSLRRPPAGRGAPRPAVTYTPRTRARQAPGVTNRQARASRPAWWAPQTPSSRQPGT